MSEFLHAMTLPFLACLVLTGIHAYLGLHVIERGVIFVDLALAQIAALGASLGILCGFELDSAASYWLSLGFTVAGALLFSFSRPRERRVPQEAVIGILYAVAAAALVLVLSRSGEGDEHIRQSLVGNILLVSAGDVWKIFVIYSGIGFFHFWFRKRFLLISQNPDEAFRQGIHVHWWDFLFFASFGVVVTSSVKIAGVLLVFSFLIVPSVCAMLFARRIQTRLLIGWAIGLAASMFGMAASYFFDFPTGATVVCVFGLILAALAAARRGVNV